jgi:hypothetical protein
MMLIIIQFAKEKKRHRGFRDHLAPLDQVFRSIHVKLVSTIHSAVLCSMPMLSLICR